MIKQTKTNRSLSVASRTLGILRFVLFMVALTGVFLYTRVGTPAPALAATSSNINFQARLLTGAGSIVADGYYNVQFNLYSVSSGGSSLWSETYYDSNGVAAGNDNRVQVRGGYLSVSLGSQTAFPALNWDQDMYLTMNIGGTTQTATPTWDGEMTPRLKLTAVPYAMSAGNIAKYNGTQTGTLAFSAVANSPNILLPDASGTVCLQTSSSCGFATGSGTAFLQGGNSFSGTTAGTLGTVNNGDLNLITNNTTKLTVTNAGNLTFNQSSIISVAAAGTANTLSITSGTATTGNNNGGNVSIQGGTPAGTGAYGNLLLQSTGGNVGIGDTSPSQKLDIVGAINIQPTIDQDGGFALKGRYWGTGMGMAVPYLVPTGPSANQYVAFDLVVKGTPANNPGLGVSWIDITDSNESEIAVEDYQTIRIGKFRDGYGYINMAEGDGGIGTNFNGLPLVLQAYAGNVGIGTTAPTGLLQVSQTTNGTGKVATNGSTTLTGTNTQFLNTFKVGDTITVSGETVRTITAIASNTSLTVSAAFSTTASGLSYTLTGGDRLTVLGNGNVGIGTVAPTAKLQVVGGGFVNPTFLVDTDAAGGGIIRLGNDATNGDYVYIGTNGILSSDAGRFGVGTNSAMPITFDIFGSEKMRIDSVGNVGIGTTLPSATLHVVSSAPAAAGAGSGAVGANGLTVVGGAGQGTTGVSGQLGGNGGVLSMTAGAGGNAPAGSTNGNGGNITLQAGTPGAGLGTAGAYGNITLNVSGGNVGIGTSGPEYKLDVSGSGNFTGQVGINLTPAAGGSQLNISPSGNNTGIIVFNNNASYTGNYIEVREGATTTNGNLLKLALNNGADTKFIVNNLGNVGIGLTGPTSALHTVATGAKTASYTGNLLTNTATSSTASINKYGLEVKSTGTWNGTSSKNVGLYVSSVTGGTNNYDAIFNGGGNVGIGTTAPRALLEVGIDSTIAPNSSITGKLKVFGSLSTTAIATEEIINLGRGFNSGVSFGKSAAFKLGGYSGGSDRRARLDINLSETADAADVTVMTLQGNGNVGIGDATPASLFTVGSGDLFQVSGTDFRLLENGATPTLYGIFDVGDLTGSNQTFTFTNGGLVCTDSGNCNGAGSSLQTSYNNSAGGNTPEIRLDATRNGLDIQDANTTLGSTTNLLTVRASDAGNLGSLLFGVQANGDVTNSGKAIVQGSSVTVGTSNATTGSIVLKNSGNANLLTLQSGTTGGTGLTLTLPTADGGSTDCLKTNGAGVLSFAACLGGGGGGVSSVNALQGALTIAGTTNQINVANGGTTITLSTPQDINTTSSPKFASLTTGSAPTTLTTVSDNPLTSGATTINVASTTSYPSGSANAPGTLLIESEIVTYTGTTATSFTGVVRGAYGSTATAHSSGVTVNNYLLNVSTGSGVSPKMVVTGNGNVGIGNAAPNYPITVVKDDGITTGSHVLGWYGRGLNTTHPGVILGYYADGSGVNAAMVRAGGTGTAADVLYLGNATEPGAIVINQSDVGIGITNPSSRLHTVATGAKTTSYTGNLLTNSATSSTASINKYGLEIQSTGTWNGTSANNVGLYVSSVTGGTNNYDAIFNGGGNVGIGLAAPAAKLHVQGEAGISSGATTMTGTSGATTFTTSASITLNAGDVIVPTTSVTRYVAVATSATGTSFTVSQAFSANITGETFTIYRRVLQVSVPGGSNANFVVQGYLGRVGVGPALTSGNPVSELSNSETNVTDTAGLGVNQFGLLWDSRANTLSGYGAVLRNSSNTGLAGGLLVSTRQSSTASYPFRVETGLAGSTTTRFVVRGDGNVGIGIAAPGAKLDIANDAAANTATGFQVQSTFAPTAGGTQTNANLVVTNAPTVAANTAVGLSLAVNDSTAFTNTLQGINLTLSDTGSTAKTVRGLLVDTSGTTNASATVTAALFKGTTTTNLVIQNGSASELMRADTTNMVLKIGTTGAPTFGATTRLFTTVAEASTTLRIGTSTDGQEFSAGAPPVYRGTGRPTKRGSLVPEYAGGVMSPDGVNNSGTMTSDFCSNSSPALNTGVCTGAGEKHNYYSWTSAAGTNDYDIYVRYQLPSDWDGLASDSTINMWGWHTGASDSVTLSMYNSGGGQCGTTTTINSATNAGWGTETALAGVNADADCTTANMAPGSTVTFVVHLTATSGNFARAGEIRFDYFSKF